MAKIQNSSTFNSRCNTQWHDDYWLLLMELYLRKPTGVKPMYNKKMVELSIELHIAPQHLHKRMCQIANLETPRIERIWHDYSRNPKRLSRAVQLLRSMIGFNSAGDFYEGVEVEETFERDFRPLSEDERLMPFMLVLILDLYFRLTPITMVKETPEVRDLASLMRIPAQLIVDVLEVFQHFDPYLNRRDVIFTPLLLPCQQVWQRSGNGDTEQWAQYAEQLKEYYK